MERKKLKAGEPVPANFTGVVAGVAITKWLVDGRLHREDGPAIIFAGGGKEWFLNGRYHRVDGPAIEFAEGEKLWYFNGQRHRVDGPACEYPDGTKRYFIYENEIENEDAYNLLVNMMKLKGLM